jgi:hypothetical protein
MLAVTQIAVVSIVHTDSAQAWKARGYPRSHLKARRCSLQNRFLSEPHDDPSKGARNRQLGINKVLRR